MTKAVFTTKISPSYKDLPELMYHFPKTYLRQVDATVGDWIIYYEPRRENASSSGTAGRQCYFATAFLSHIADDPDLKDHFFAFVKDYIEFSNPVPFKIGNNYFENKLKKNDGTTNKGAFGRAVRNISNEEYQEIVTYGLEVVKEEVSTVNEESLDFDINRPIIKKLISRPFREVAFSKIIKEEYNMTCAMTGINILNECNKAEVEAAHIKPVKYNGPDSLRNGIALCRTFHWLFDNGLISVADNNEILVKTIVPDRVTQLINTNGKINGPKNFYAIPHPEFFKFHREYIYTLER